MMEKIYLRHAKASDMDIFYAWRNEETVRKNSFNEDWVNYADHEKWFLAALSNPSEEIWVLCVKDERVGQVRLTYKEDEAHLSYSIAREYRGQGYGKMILRLLENEIFDREPIIKIIAQVKKENVASQVVFKSCDYSETLVNNYFSYEKIPMKQINIIENQFHTGGAPLNE